MLGYLQEPHPHARVSTGTSRCDSRTNSVHGMLKDRILQVAGRNSGIITLDQLRELGHSPRLARGRIERGQWRRMMPGVFLAEPGPPTWEQRAIAALKWAGPIAALSHESAGWMNNLLNWRPRHIDVTVPKNGKTHTPRWSLVRIHRTSQFPPVIIQPFRYTAMIPTLMDLLDQTERPDDVVGLITAALRHPVLTDDLLYAVLDRHDLRNRALARDILAAADEGVESPLEYRFHRDVEKAHGLPRAMRQRWERTRSGMIRSDARYPEYGVRVELDGELAHPGRATSADLYRDNDVLIDTGERTFRYRWTHVAGTPCRTASQLGRALRQGGWEGSVRVCGPGCSVLRW